MDDDRAQTAGAAARRLSRVRQRFTAFVTKGSSLTRRAMPNGVAGIAVAIAALLITFLALPRLHAPQPFDRPVRVGRLIDIDLMLYVGDVAVPNQPEAVTTDGWKLGTRVKHWDAYLITAPVPEVLQTPEGVQLLIPWTLLPLSVVDRVSKMDDQCGKALAASLGLKEGPTV